MADDETQEALVRDADELAVDAKHSAAMARSRALDHAVSQGLQAQLHPQKPSIVRWERFLPQEQLRVLLVEDDNSTGHVVTALLRNCGYEVLFASNGLLAWELLMDQSNKVDLVLTEVVMPGLSGIGLLLRIMNHEPLKHIPVIMMSCLDSMGVVFKCLSKGAVDFLVKPVRKNELKNLWQHIWRRCHSSSGSRSGSGSGSGSQTQKVAQPDTAGEANDSGSNDESDNMSSELNLEGGSDNGSGTQSSWTKKAVEVESSHQGLAGDSRLDSSIQSKDGCLLGPDNQKEKDDGVSLDTNLTDSRAAVAELPFFNKDQVNLNAAPELVMITTSNDKDTRNLGEGVESALPYANRQMVNGSDEIPTKEQEGADEQQADSEDVDDLLEKHASNSPSSKDKTLSDCSSPPLLQLSLKRPSQAENDREGEVRGALKRSCCSAFSRYANNGNNTPVQAGTISAKISLPANGLGDHSLLQGSSARSTHPSSIPLSSWIDKPPFRMAGTDEMMTSSFFSGNPHDSSNQNISLADTFHPGNQNPGSCLVKEEVTCLNSTPGTHAHLYPSHGVPNAPSSCEKPFSGDTNLPLHWGLSSENIEAQESHVPHRPIQAHESTHAKQDAQVHHHTYHHHHHHHHHVQHHYHPHQDQPQQRSQTPQLEDSTVINAGASVSKCGSSNMEKCPVENNGQSGSFHHHHHVQHHYHHHQDQPQQRPQIPQLEDSTVINAGESVPKCGSSNMEKCTEENNGQSGSCNGYGSNGNGAVSLNGSATGSNGGQSAATEPAGTGNVDSSTQIGPGSGLTAVHGFLLGPDESRHAQREAALTKFRRKRKERCFEKKVRYQSRKRLAEQRPRVRGQFVRQTVK